MDYMLIKLLLASFAINRVNCTDGKGETDTAVSESDLSWY